MRNDTRIPVNQTLIQAGQSSVINPPRQTAIRTGKKRSFKSSNKRNDESYFDPLKLPPSKRQRNVTNIKYQNYNHNNRTHIESSKTKIAKQHLNSIKRSLKAFMDYSAKNL